MLSNSSELIPRVSVRSGVAVWSTLIIAFVLVMLLLRRNGCHSPTHPHTVSLPCDSCFFSFCLKPQLGKSLPLHFTVVAVGSYIWPHSAPRYFLLHQCGFWQVLSFSFSSVKLVWIGYKQVGGGLLCSSWKHGSISKQFSNVLNWIQVQRIFGWQVRAL